MSERKCCSECGRCTGYLMETHPDKPGALQVLRGEAGQIYRWVLVAILVVIATTALLGAATLFHLA